MGGVLGKKKPQFKVEPKQEVELEIVSADNTSIENYFTRVLQVDKKKFTVQVPTRDRQQAPINTGDSLTVTYLNDDSINSFETKVAERREREMDLNLPTHIVAEKTPDPASDFALEIPIPVEYRAMSTAHLQTAMTRAITNIGIQILTNLPIPVNTSLHIELEIPSSPPIKTKGKVIKSERLASDTRKSLTELEFEDITPEDRSTIFRYAMFYQQRQIRKQKLLSAQQS